MSDLTLQCLLPLAIMAIVWFALFEARKKSRQAPMQSLTLPTKLSRQEIAKIVNNSLPRSLISSAFNWSVQSIRDELRISGYYLTNGLGCLVLLVTGIIPGYLLLLLTRDETESVTIDFSSLEDTGLVKVITAGSHAQKITEKLIPKLEHKQNHLQWDEAVITATTTKGGLTELSPGKGLDEWQDDNDPQSETDKGNRAKTHLERAHGYLQKEEFVKALHESQRAIQSIPDSAETYNQLGVILDSLGRRIEAIDAYEQALILDPALTDAQRNLAEVLQENEEELRLIRSPESQLAFEAFCRVSSQATMNQTVARYPFMTTIYFVRAVEEVISKQVPINDRPLFERRRAWLETAVENERAQAASY